MIRAVVGLLAIALCSLELADRPEAAVPQDAPAVEVADVVSAADMSIEDEVAYVSDAIRGGAQVLVCAGGPGSPYCLWCLSGGCHGNTICYGACIACCH